MSATALVRSARPEDLPALVELEALFPSDAMSRRSLRHFIQAASADFLVADHDGELLGNLLLLHRSGSTTARIYSVVVAPRARGMGLGRDLVLAAEAHAAARGCRQIRLEVRVDNAPARTLYERLGYTLESPLPAYYDDGCDGLRLVKTLDAPA